MDRLSAYRPWFFAAALYNAVWGVAVSIWPGAVFQMLGMKPPIYPCLMQAIGMMVGVYAIGYGLVWRDPVRFGPFVYVGLAGKLLGPLGFLWNAWSGQLPWSFGWMNVSNDLVWLPAFILFARQVWIAEKRTCHTAAP